MRNEDIHAFSSNLGLFEFFLKEKSVFSIVSNAGEQRPFETNVLAIIEACSINSRKFEISHYSIIF